MRDGTELFGAGLDRRRFLEQTTASLGAGLALALVPGEALGAAPKLGRNPFTLGVAAGEPVPDGAVLWTRLAPRPLSGSDGGMPQVAAPVEWRVAEDEGMRRVVRRGRAAAMPELAHSVHVEVEGLRPGRVYHYQFSYRGDESAVGRFKTAPAATDRLERLRFAFCTCQSWSSGFYTAYADMVRQDLDVVFHLGDYIYENESADNNRGSPIPSGVDGDVFDLERYRLLHALYKSDRNLQAAHAAFAFFVIWDDHEVVNDYAGRAPDFQTAAFLRQRAAAYQAFYEHLPLRRLARPSGPELRLYRRARFGDLVEFNLLDDRQYRTAPPCGYGEQFPCVERWGSGPTMLGRNQERWLYDGLSRSGARWNVLAQQVLMAQLDHQDQGKEFWTDSWDGYPAARNRLLDVIRGARVANPVVITGDWHSTFVNDLKRDFDDEQAPVLATEFVTPAITTGGDGTPYGPYYGPMIPFNPHIKYFEGDRRGYFLARLTRDRLEADLRFVSRVERPTATAEVERTFVVENGRPGAQMEGV